MTIAKFVQKAFLCSQNKSQVPTGLIGLLSIPMRRAKSIFGVSLVRTQEAVPLCNDFKFAFKATQQADFLNLIYT